MWIICQADNSYEMSRLFFYPKENKNKKLHSDEVQGDIDWLQSPVTKYIILFDPLK